MNIKDSVSDLYLKINSCSEFINKLKYNEYYFKPALEGVTEEGSNLELGFSCYGLKFNYLSGSWDDLSKNDKNNWIDKINSYQLSDKVYK